MKTRNTFFKFLYAAIFTGAVFSCTKEVDKTSNCRIVSMTSVNSTGTTIYTLTYNNDGKISTLSTSGSLVLSKIFTYIGNTVIANSTTGSGSSASTTRDSITVDGRGRPLNIRRYYNQSRTSWTNSSLEYSGDDLLRIVNTFDNSSAPSISTCTSSNSNLLSILDPSGATTTFEYYTDEEIQPGDFLEILGLTEYGVSIYPHKNLTKTFAIGTSIINFNYEKNSDGMITVGNATGGSGVSRITYQYECD